MPMSFTTAARRFLSVKAVGPFLFGSLALGILSNAAFTVLTNLAGTGTQSLLLIIVGAVSILALMVLLFARYVYRHIEVPPPPGKTSPAKRRGLILLVSNEDVCRKAIEHHTGTLEQLWLICSTRTLAIAESLRQHYPAVVTDEPLVTNDVFDVFEVYRLVDGIYARLPDGWTPGEVIADFTGMTALASVGMVLACRQAGRPMQYVSAHFDEGLKAIRPGDPFEVTFPTEPTVGKR